MFFTKKKKEKDYDIKTIENIGMKIKIFNYEVASLQDINSSEIMEILIKLEKILDMYNQLLDSGYNIYDESEINNLAKNTIKSFISKKIEFCINNDNKKEMLLSLKDELLYCNNRYTKFSKYINTEIIKLENIIEDI